VKKNSMIDERIPAICKRMRQIRALWGKKSSQEEFAAQFAIGDSAWSNYESNRRPGLDNALNIVRRLPTLTLDWIYRGDPRGIQLDVLRALDEAGEPPPRTKVKSGRRS
jgi:hypothetical protein